MRQQSGGIRGLVSLAETWIIISPHFVDIPARMNENAPLRRFPAIATLRRRLAARTGMLVPLGLLALFVVGLAGLALSTGWGETFAHIARIGPGQLALLLALSLVNYLARAIRWHMMTRRAGLPTRPGQSLRHFLGGFAMSVTPARLGELVRMRWLYRETGRPIEQTAPLALLDRAADLGAMGLLLALAVAFTAGGGQVALWIAAGAVALAYAVTRPALMNLLVTRAWRGIGRFPRLFARLRRGVRVLEPFAGAGIAAPLLALGAIGWLAEGYAFHLLLAWLGADIGAAAAVAIFMSATLAGGLTGAPGGLGGAEAAMMGLLVLQGVPADMALAATAIIRVTTFWFAILTGIAVFPLAERLSLRVEHAR
ncbi:uncharacterized protein (TIRG00374 family) [Brevirhabdus pacifica]|nr:uncharacterized protein (TIRG00374 family) [Brevirhabdus pacifica]